MCADTATEAAEILGLARQLLETEARALGLLGESLGDEFVSGVKLVLGCDGRVITTGVGKAGIIAQKLAGTLASTGTRADFLHPTEALHGDLGRVTEGDLVVALSNSGTTEEVLRLVGPLKALGARLLAITADGTSPLARHADVTLSYGRVTEACPLGLAPTTSTTVMLALGDALAMAVLKERRFTPEQFARFHPAGNLGRSLMRVEEAMRTGDALPLVQAAEPLRRSIDVMTTTPGRPGAVLVVDGERLVGMFTDGDLRRVVAERSDGERLDLERPIADVMTPGPTTVGPGQLLGEAQRILRERKIDQLPVVDADGRAVGLLDVQDLLDVRILPSPQAPNA